MKFARFFIIINVLLLCFNTAQAQANQSAPQQQYMPGNAVATAQPAAPQGQSATPSNPQTNTNTPAESISKQKFIDRVGNALTVHYCHANSPILKDFGVSLSQCQSAMQVAKSECGQQLLPNMPAMISTAQQAGHWGEQLGTCIGKNFAKSLQSLKNNTTPTPATKPAPSQTPLNT